MTRDRLRFGVLVVVALHAYGGAAGQFAVRRIVLSAGLERGRACAQNLRRAAIVRPQRQHCHPRVVHLYFGERAWVGAIPAVDRLPRVADEADIGPATSNALQHGVLQRVEVLCLVDEEVAITPAHSIGPGRVGAQGT